MREFLTLAASACHCSSALGRLLFWVEICLLSRFVLAGTGGFFFGG
jgi:hypothetical protein